MSKAVVLPEQYVSRIENILDELLAKTRANYVFLADISGQLINGRGIAGSTDIVSLAALTASNMAATAEMARKIGEPQPFHLMFHEGDKRNIYLSQVGTSFLLAVIFTVEVPIGLVRLFSKRAVEELQTLATEYESAISQTPAMMETGFDGALEDALDTLLPSKGKTPTDQIIIG